MKLLPVYFTGTYGSEVRTDISYVPLIFSLESPRQEFKVTVPYLSIHTEEPVAFVEGEVITRGDGLETTESGPGDVIVREEVYLLQGSRTRPWIWGGVRIKLPTADERRGLGTGELDYGPAAGLIQPLGASWLLMVSVDHVVRGDPEGFEFRNTTWYSAGVQLRPTPEDSLGTFYERRESVFEGRDALEDVSLYYARRLSPAVSFPVTIFYGLSDTAEDWGLSLGLSVR